MSDVFNTEDEADRKRLLDHLEETNAAPDFQAGLTVEEKLKIEARSGLEKSRKRVKTIIEKGNI